MDENKCELSRVAEELKTCFRLFTALGEENRQQILVTILESGAQGMRVPQITAATKLSRPAVSHHLKILKESGLIGMRSVGTKNFYFVSADKQEWEKITKLVHTIDNLIKNAYIN